MTMTSTLCPSYFEYSDNMDTKCLVELCILSRCCTDAIDQLPADYMKVLYRAILNLFKETENDLSKQGRSYAAYYVKEEFKDLVRAYRVEAQWAAKGQVPTFDEYIRNGLTTTVYGVIMAASFLGMEEVAGVEEYERLKSNQKIVRAGKMIGRLMNDIVGHEIDFKKEKKERNSRDFQAYRLLV
ncbi:unnamed protein product [Dovyalis caffra]|uniref:Terpene synthase metal-binding domain-containing protein n=1 Tax=Dovyalis caffra TaxID=77055 RepID=A0AAV1RJI8_9ROSI|nr:unnamed protein product [Dovyalis caffra]